MSHLTISAVGDISFNGFRKEISKSLFNNVTSILKQTDLNVANLESPLLTQGEPVYGKCTLKGHTDYVACLKEAGICVVSIANNHMMDFGVDGLFSTIEELKKEKIDFVGAGRNLQEAESPVIIDKKGIKIGFLARTSVIVSSPCYAANSKPGVAFLKEKQTIEAIKCCKEYVDILVFLVHWGLENYHYPAPSQRALAEKLVNAGADIILGHHPHVLQGVENIGLGIVAYSLGNFVFDETAWSFIDEEGIQQDRVIILSTENREGVILKLVLSKHGMESHEYLPTVYPEGGVVELDNTSERKKGFSCLCSRLKWPCYNFIWKIYAIKQEWVLRIVPLVRGKMNWSKIKKVRLKHFKRLINKVSHSAKVTSEKTTDPYS